MKKLLILTICAGILSGCAASGPHESAFEKEQQRGFHAKQAKEIIDKNEKNKAANKKAAEKSKREQNDHLNALNRNKGKTSSMQSRTIFLSVFKNRIPIIKNTIRAKILFLILPVSAAISP